KEAFTDSEISELLAVICFITACQRLGALLDLGPSCQI
ncbi:MAG TPA: alkylhydroperoxidase, partial [Syntrophomonas sp.]|nr:alkylhydroperoxidase [Syntrophomonas sp.]